MAVATNTGNITYIILTFGKIVTVSVTPICYHEESIL